MFVHIKNDYINLNHVTNIEINTAHKQGPNYSETGEIFTYKVTLHLSSGQSKVIASKETPYQAVVDRHLKDIEGELREILKEASIRIVDFRKFGWEEDD